MRLSSSMKHNYEFRRLYATGKSAATSHLALYCKRNRNGKSQLGITVGSKVGKAVQRNRIRRRLKEIYRRNETHIRPGFDIVIVARVRSREASFCQLESDFLRLIDKLNLRV